METWTIDEKTDYMLFLFSANYPRHGASLRAISWMPGSPWFTCEDSTISGIKRDAENNLFFELTVNYKGPPIPEGEEFGPDKEILPWHLPLEGYATASEVIEEAATVLYDRRGKKRPFRTSAGTEILSARQRNILGISFKYNLPKNAFFEEYQISYKDKINSGTVKIAGRNYKEGTVKITNLSAELLQYKFGETGGWEDYWRVSLNLSVDPLTWWRQFVNASTYFLPAPGKPLAQIWSTETNVKTQQSGGGSQNQESGNPLYDYMGQEIKSLENNPRTAPETKATKHFGTYDEMSMLNSSSLQEVTEPLYLFPDAKTMSALGISAFRPDRFGNEIDASGGILPFDMQTGKQFLGTYSKDNGLNSRFGCWKPIVFDDDGKMHAVSANTANIDDKLIHETFVEGYQTPLVEFDNLYIPSHKGMRWNERYNL